MIIPEVFELNIIGVHDRGVPNKERICIQAMMPVNMAQFAILIGLRSEQGASPLNDNFFWFGDGVVQQNDWIFVYTGPGDPRSTTIPNSETILHSVHWNRKQTIFNHPDILPLVIKIGSVKVIDDTRREKLQIKG